MIEIGRDISHACACLCCLTWCGLWLFNLLATVGQEQCRTEGCERWTVQNIHHLCIECNRERRKATRKKAPDSKSIAVAPRERSKRPYETLGPTQQRKRRRAGDAALEKIGVTAAAIVGERVIQPEALIGVSTATRNEIRTIPGLKIAGEQRIADFKELLAVTHGTATDKLENENGLTAAWITDPILFVRTVAEKSRVIAVGGDAGGGYTKLGITYTDVNKKQTFAALLIYSGKDTYDELNQFKGRFITPFTGESAHLDDIFSFFQLLIDTRLTMLNGDWPFISAMLGHKGHASTFFCPICIVGNQHKLAVAKYREPGDRESIDKAPFVRIRSDRIVPLPLHLYLGINDRIINDVFVELLGAVHVDAQVARVKTSHTPGCGGLSDIYRMDGPEVHRWIKWGLSEEALRSAEAAGEIKRDAEAKVRILASWMETLEDRLLSAKVWETEDLKAFRTFLNDIYDHWTEVTGHHAFPKLHMLRHALEFAETYHFLGKVSEAQIESCHAQFNEKINEHHLNMSHHPDERIRRGLADTGLEAVAPMAGLVPAKGQSARTSERLLALLYQLHS